MKCMCNKTRSLLTITNSKNKDKGKEKILSILLFQKCSIVLYKALIDKKKLTKTRHNNQNFSS